MHANSSLETAKIVYERLNDERVCINLRFFSLKSRRRRQSNLAQYCYYYSVSWLSRLSFFAILLYVLLVLVVVGWYRFKIKPMQTNPDRLEAKHFSVMKTRIADAK